MVDSTQSSIQQNLIASEPSLSDLLNLFKKNLLLNFNVHHIGTIQSFNPITQTASATINYKKTFFEPKKSSATGNSLLDAAVSAVTSSDEATATFVPVLKDYPQIIDAPVISLGGGSGALTFPIESGDECFILFNDRDIDNWYSGNPNGAVATPRLHSFSDAIIIVGVRSLRNVLLDYDVDSVALTYSGNKVRIYDDKFSVDLTSGVSLEIDATGKLKITNATGELIAMLVQLFTDIQNGLVSTLLGPEPLTMPTFTTDLAKLQSFKA